MDSHFTVPLGVVVAREKIDHPWQEFIWRPTSVFLDAEPVADWRMLRADGGIEHYHAATLPLEFHRKETASYLANLANGPPAIYVVLREGAAGASSFPMHVHLVTASPFEVQAYGHGSEESVDRVPMPEPLIELMQAFVETHHTEDAVIKRRRAEHHIEDEHKFGQEPLAVLRARMPKSARATGGTKRA